VWDTQTRKQLRTLTGHKSAIFCVTVSPDGKYIVSGGGSRWGREDRRAALGEMCVWEAATGKLIRRVEADHDVVNGVAVSSDSKQIATAGWDRRVIVWDIATGKTVHTLTGHRAEKYSSAWAVAFSPDGKLQRAVPQKS
jgi:WD40 repeat protein